MKVDSYEALLTDLCREVDVDAAPLLQDGRLVVDDTEVALACEAAADGEHLWICVDFGAVPEAQAHRVYRAMLLANLRSGGLEVGVFTLHSTGRAALIVRRPLTAAITGELLAQALLHYAAVAKSWIASACGAPPGGYLA
jgi:hypothetical protein